MKKFILLLLAALPLLAAHSQDPVTDYYIPGYFPVVSEAGATAIYVDPKDHWLVRKAAALLQDDIQRVTGIQPEILTTLPLRANPMNLIIIGSLDQSAMIKSLAYRKRISSNKLEGKWESFLWETVRGPAAGVNRALVIAGSDQRGTAYGVLELSRQIGVSPWVYWADVPVKKKNYLFVSNKILDFGPPAVKYRGFFINDEAPALSGWAREKFGGFNHYFYEKVFELLLRLKANYLWPAMWGNAFNDDDPQNPVLASQYGIVMGTSHHEPMLRAQQEWKRYGSGPWDYRTNPKVLDSFWQTGIRHMGSHESIVTIGMRGDGDKPMEEGSNIALLEKIVQDQRDILRKITGKAPSAIPQSWALYKEVQDYYDKGMRVPDDVTLLLCDDNWGNVRKLPVPGENPRGGGYGMYYHFDYVGDPRNYKWLNTNQVSRVWEQMHLTKEYGDDRIWIVNVGDIKPMELPIEFFMDYAWDPSRWPADKLPGYTRNWAAEQFGPVPADLIAAILTKYTTYNSRRKPELLSPDTYSLLNYREAEQVAAGYNELVTQAQNIYGLLPAGYQDAFDELVLYPVQACANLNDLYFSIAKNRLYAAQGRASANLLAAKAGELFEKDSVLARHYNQQIASGKWDHMMDQTHIGYTYWQEPRYNKMPEVKTLPPSGMTGPSWGLSVEGSASWWPGNRDSAGNDPASAAVLPSFNPYDHEQHFIDLFCRTPSPFAYTVTARDPWVKISARKGTIDLEQRIWIDIDWTKAPAGKSKSSLNITGAGDSTVSAELVIDNPAAPRPEQFKGFTESNGYISIPAQDYMNAIGSAGIGWQVIPDIGRTLSGVQAFPVTAPAQTAGDKSPRLEYDLYLFDTGTISIQAYFSPILAFNRQPIHYGISVDDEAPQIIDLSTGNEAKDIWSKMVSDNIRISSSLHRIGRSGKHVLKFWLVDPGPVLQKIVVDAGGVKPSYLGPPETQH